MVGLYINQEKRFTGDNDIISLQIEPPNNTKIHKLNKLYPNAFDDSCKRSKTN